jgi:hypothetical protein
LSNDRLNTVSVAKGGTGATTLTANNVLLGNGTSALQVVAPGTAGNVLTSNGTTWSSTTPASGGFSGATTTSSATDITLTNTSTQVQYVSMTAANKFVILPDATTLTKGSPVFVIINNGEYPFHVKNSAGDIIIFGVVSGQTENLTLVTNATAAGSWATDASTINLGGGLPQISSITASGEDFLEPTVAMLSATEALIFYCPSATAISVVLATISGNSVTYGTPVAVVTGGTPNYYFLKAMRFNATTGIVTYINGTTDDAFMRAITVSGSTVTVGSAVTLTTSGVGWIYSGYMAMLDSTTGFVGYVQSTPTVTIRAFTVSGSTITLGTATNVSTDANYFLGATQISSGKVLFGYVNTGVNRFRVVTNSGTTLTLGAQATAIGVASSMLTQNAFDKLATDVVSGVGSGSAGYNSIIVPVSGTTVGTVINTLVGIEPIPNGGQRIKYLSDNLQIAYGSYANNRSALTLYKGNSSVGANAVYQFNLGLHTQLYGTPLDVNSNKIIVVGILNELLVSQIVGVL